ncbi:MAG: hypothetical protein AB1481_05095 [Candidatus Omnitrophota bacterium]
MVKKRKPVKRRATKAQRHKATKKVKKTGLKRKLAKKKPAIKKPVKAAAKARKGLIGVVTHYFPQVRAAVIKLKTGLSMGDYIKIKGHTTDFTQKVTSMQIDRVDIEKAKKGQEIGLLVDSRVRQNDEVYKG